MADENFVENFDAAALKFNEEVKWDKVYRSNLGELSINEFEDNVSEIVDKLEKTKTVVKTLTNPQLKSFANAVNAISDTAIKIAEQDQTTFAQQRDNHVNALRTVFEGAIPSWQPIYITILEASGISDEASDVSSKLSSVVADLEKHTAKAIEAIESTKVSAVDHAKSIMGEARKTSLGISFKEAQEIFEGAVTSFNKRVKVWSWVSGIFAFLSICLLIYYLNFPPDKSLKYGLIYFITIRVALFGVFAGLTAYAFGLVKINMHLREANDHRKRIANAMSTLIEAGQTPTQRDLILGMLADALVALPDQGFIKNSGESDNKSKMSIENIVRNVTPNVTSGGE